MRENVRNRILLLREAGELRGLSGKMHQMDGITFLPIQLCECLADLHKSVRPDFSVETGLVYGFSTLSFLDVMEECEYGNHVAIDFTQKGDWDGVALVAIEELDLAAEDA